MLSQEEFDFIKQNINEDHRSLALKTHGKFKESMGFLLNQIKLKQKSSKKLPSWYSSNKLLFPSNQSFEQCSSEITANYKSQLVSGKTAIDISGGLGIDSIALSHVFEEVTHVEYNEEVQKYCAHNFKELSKNNIQSIHGDGIEILKSTQEKFDLIFVDPDRRPDLKRANELEECLPNVIDHLDLLLSKAQSVFIKASPMCDINKSIAQLKFVKEIHVVSHKNECKEVLFLLENNFEDVPSISAVELGTKHSLTTEYSSDYLPQPVSQPKNYLYDPFVSYRKAKLSDSISKEYNMNPITSEGTLLTGDELIETFPGRIFEVTGQVNLDRKKLSSLRIKKANVISRGLPLKSDEIASKLKIKDGGETYLIAFQNFDQKSALLICKRRNFKS